MIARLLTAVLLAVAALSLPAAAQVAPAANYTDMWYLPSESGWGVSFTQHNGSNQVFAVWYTYDPRQPDPASPGGFKPLWIVMPGGTWTTPTSITGPVFVTNGQPFNQTGSDTHPSPIGTFHLQFLEHVDGHVRVQHRGAHGARERRSGLRPALHGGHQEHPAPELLENPRIGGCKPSSSRTPIAPCTRWARATPNHRSA